MHASFLPSVPEMLVSMLNMLLRDEEYDSLEDLCLSFERDMDEILDMLRNHGYVYCPELKQVRPVDSEL